MPDDELPLATDFEDDRRGIADFIRGEGVPKDLTGVAVKGDDALFLAADQADDLVAVHERVR